MLLCILTIRDLAVLDISALVMSAKLAKTLAFSLLEFDDGYPVTDFNQNTLFSASRILVFRARLSWAYWMAVADSTLSRNAVFTSIPADLCGNAVLYDGDSVRVLYMTHSGPFSVAASFDYLLCLGWRFSLFPSIISRPSSFVECSSVATGILRSRSKDQCNKTIYWTCKSANMF